MIGSGYIDGLQSAGDRLCHQRTRASQACGVLHIELSGSVQRTVSGVEREIGRLTNRKVKLELLLPT